MGVFKLFGTSIFGLSLLKNGLLFLTYLFVYKLGMLLMNSKLKASLSAISLMLIPQLVWGAQVDQTHTVLLTTATAISIYYFFKIAQEESSLLDFIMFGVAIGVGLNAKYNFLLVVVALIIISLVIKEFRSRFYERRLIFSIGITLLMVLPHFLWFISHLEIATNRTIERMSAGDTQNNIINFFKGNFSLIVSTIAFLTPFWIAFIILFRKKFSISLNDYSKSLLLYMIIVFLFLFVIILISGSTHVKERWLQPYLFLVPLFLFLHVKILQIDKQVNTFIYLSILASIVVALVVLIKPYTIDLRGKPSRASYPFEQLSKQIKNKIQSSKNVLLYTEDKYIGGNLKLFLPDTLVITPSLP
ncbi:ArnT family glycosyltransferase, partial [Sulfurovum sp.]|uniref:ArnT family glycosyltransferase n=1 Tax=Sulfurovum sp. TaxID=1969726 RepID=UPI003567DA60